MRPLRLVFLTNEFPTELQCDGGLSQYLGRVTSALAQMGHDVHVITGSQLSPGKIMYGDVHVHRVYYSTKIHHLQKITFHKFKNTLWYLHLSYKWYRAVRELHLQKPVDLVQAPNVANAGLVTQLRTCIPTVVRISSNRRMWEAAKGTRRTLDQRIVERLEIASMRRAERCIGPTQLLVDIAKHDFGIEDIRVIRTPFYIEVEDLDDSVYREHLAGKAYALYFGRLELHKGAGVIAHAMRAFLEAHHDAYVVCVGRDRQTVLASSMLRYMREQAGPCADRFIHIEPLAHRQLYPIIQHARLVMLPSLMDNLPNALLESLGLGKVVIGTRGASFDEVLTHNKDGLLIEKGDPQQLAQTLIDAWDRADLPEMEREAKRTSEQFRVEKTVGDLLDLYDECLGRGEARQSD